MTGLSNEELKVRSVAAKLNGGLTEEEQEQAMSFADPLWKLFHGSVKCASCGRPWEDHCGYLCPENSSLFVPVE